VSILSQRYFWDEEAAHGKLEEIVWPNGPVCIHCGATDRIGAVTGKGARAGLKFCCRCRKQFRATIGTIFEGSHVPLYKWFQACLILSAVGSSITAYQLHLRLEVTNKTAMGIIQRLQGRIMGTREGSGSVEPDWPSGAKTGAVAGPVLKRSRLAERPAQTSSTIGWDELPWMGFPARPRRQFLRFVETARELGCIGDEESFDRVLAALGTQPEGRARTPRRSPSFGSPPRFAEPARGLPIPAAA
jgi:hypothetical protein